MRIKHTTGAAGSLVHDGAVYAPEEDGYFRIPFDLAQTLLKHPFWEAEPAVPVVQPEPEEPELTPAQKGALTKAAKAAEAADADAT